MKKMYFVHTVDAESVPENSPSRVGGGEVLENKYIFSAVHETSRTFLILTQKTASPVRVGSLKKY